MEKEKDIHSDLKFLDKQMLLVKNFISELFRKTVMQDGGVSGSDFAPSQMRALLAFSEDKEYSIGELGRNAQAKSSTITDMIDRLENDGIAERFRDGDDRRVVNVRLTDKGRKLRREFSQKRRKEMEAIFLKLSQEDRKHLIHHLSEAYKILRKVQI